MSRGDKRLAEDLKARPCLHMRFAEHLEARSASVIRYTYKIRMKCIFVYKWSIELPRDYCKFTIM